MHHIMFDIDGTLVESFDFDSDCFVRAVKEVINVEIEAHWSKYLQVTDAGILNSIIESNGIEDKEACFALIKNNFISKIKQYIKTTGVKSIPGANLFLEKLKSMENVSLSLATGGWYETAILKLNAAGINYSGIPIASANDHSDRTEIMKMAATRAGHGSSIPYTYFGDAIWDQNACKQLGLNFILVGNKIDHTPAITNFNEIDKLLSLINIK